MMSAQAQPIAQLSLERVNIQSRGHTTVTAKAEVVFNLIVNLPPVDRDRRSCLLRRTRCIQADRTPLSMLSAVSLKESVERVASFLESEQSRLGQSSDEYNPSRETLNNILNRTIASVLSVAQHGALEAHSAYDLEINNQILSMQKVLDDFMNEENAPQSQSFSTLWTICGQLGWISHRTDKLSRFNAALAGARLKIGDILDDVRAPYLFKGVFDSCVSFLDFFGATWSLPERACSDPKVFHEVLGLIFKDGPAQGVVATRGFDIHVQDKPLIVGSEDWERAIDEGEEIQLRVVIHLPPRHEKRLTCPRCGKMTRSRCNDPDSAYCVSCEVDINLRPPPAEEAWIVMKDNARGNSAAFKFYSIRVDTNSKSTARSVRWNESLIFPTPLLARKGWFNRRGDQLWTNDGASKPSPEEAAYPFDLSEYPEPGEGWMNEEGVRIDMFHRLVPRMPLRSALKKGPIGSRKHPIVMANVRQEKPQN